MSVEFEPGEINNLGQKLLRYRYSLDRINEKSSETICLDGVLQLEEMVRLQGCSPEEAYRLVRLVAPISSSYETVDLEKAAWRQELSLAPLRLVQQGYPDVTSGAFDSNYMGEAVFCALLNEKDCENCCSGNGTQEIVNLRCKNRDACSYKVTRNIIQNEIRTASGVKIYSVLQSEQQSVDPMIESLVDLAIKYGLWTREAAEDAASQMLYAAQDYIYRAEYSPDQETL